MICKLERPLSICPTFPPTTTILVWKCPRCIVNGDNFRDPSQGIASLMYSTFKARLNLLCAPLECGCDNSNSDGWSSSHVVQSKLDALEMQCMKVDHLLLVYQEAKSARLRYDAWFRREEGYG